jgi:hypothetical protein
MVKVKSMELGMSTMICGGIFTIIQTIQIIKLFNCLILIFNFINHPLINKFHLQRRAITFTLTYVKLLDLIKDPMDSFKERIANPQI